ncbi:hypothetical protein B0H10DRAFT_694305 [Mycena sp. CBHHK59/15]|nr:hypothetical protein B0H10DRAFT_694305 [Mycena sp. CBHHK59/15]
MITLEAVDDDDVRWKPPVEISFARLCVQGKVDETEVVDPDDADADGRKLTKEEKEKRKMRSKGKSLKRYVRGVSCVLIDLPSDSDICRCKEKNVIDPTAVAIRAKLEK